MTTWDAFEPFVLPLAPECPGPTLEHFARQAAIEFFDRTKVWVQDLAANIGDGSAVTFALAMPAESVAVDLKNVAITDPGLQPIDATLPTPDDGEMAMRDGDMRRIAFSRDLVTLTVWPAPVASAAIVAKMALKPSQASTGIPSWVFEQHAQDISYGALSKILGMTKSDSVTWTDKQLAAEYAGRFEARIASVRLATNKGRAHSKRRPTTRYY